MWCVSMSVIVLARDGFPLSTGALGPFLMLCLVLSFVFAHMLCGSCTGGMCHFSFGMNVVIATNYVGNLFCLLDIRFIDDQSFDNR